MVSRSNAPTTNPLSAGPALTINPINDQQTRANGFISSAQSQALDEDQVVKRQHVGIENYDDVASSDYSLSKMENNEDKINRN